MDLTEDKFVEMINNWSGFVQFPTEETLKKMKYKVQLENLFTPKEFKKLTKLAKRRIKNINNLYSIMLLLGMPLPSENALRVKVGLPPHRKLVCKPNSDGSGDDETWKPYKKKSTKSSMQSASEYGKHKKFIISKCLSNPNGKAISMKEYEEESSALLGTWPKELLSSLKPIEVTSKENTSKEKTLKENYVKEKTAKSVNSSYTLRGVKKDFTESEVPDDDHYLYCDSCEKVFEGECAIHGPYIHVQDSRIKMGLCNRARQTCPDGISIGPSKIRSGGLGAWAEKDFEVNSVFGPYEGKNVHKDDLQKLILIFDGGYAWEIYKFRKLSHYIDGSGCKTSNWLRYVNCARNEEEQNLIAYQYKGQIFYRAYKKIQRGMELLVWYGSQYAEQLGIIADKMVLKPSENFQKFSDEHRECMKCGRLFADDTVLQKHLKSKHPDRSIIKRFKCEICNYSCDNLADLKKHIRTHNKEKPFECLHCNKKFSQKSSLVCHIRIHTGEKPYECKKCGEKFNVSTTLKTHIRTVHDKCKSFVCKICGYMSGRSMDYKNHMLTHTGVRNYKCQYCDKRFTQAGNLKKHERIHTGEKPYKCKECSSAFTQLNELNNHVIVHHTRKFRYRCFICNKGFLAPGLLKKHESCCKK